MEWALIIFIENINFPNSKDVKNVVDNLINHSCGIDLYRGVGKL